MVSLNGQIGTLDNQSAKAASVDIKGKVDKYAPWRHQRPAHPIRPAEQPGYCHQLQNVELTTLTPYSGKFAGFRIRKAASTSTCITR